MERRFCPHCGAPVNPGDVVCSNCGAPLNSNEDTVLNGQPTGGQYYSQNRQNGYGNYSNYGQQPSNGGGNKLIIILLAVLIFILVVGGIVGFIIYSSNKKAEEKAKTEEVLQEQKDSIAALSKKNDSLKVENAKKPKTVTKVVVSKPRGVPASQATEVVITGQGVRMRVGPGKQYDYPVTYSGHAYTVAKGTSLPFLGEYGNWNKVLFEGGEYWVSKDFSYLR